MMPHVIGSKFARAPLAAVNAALLAALALSAPAPAHAQGTPAAAPASAAATPDLQPKLVAVYLEGTDTEMVTGDLVAVLPKTIRVVSSDAFESALVKAGQRGPFGPVLGQPKQRARALGRLRKAAAAVNAEAVIVARVRHEGGVVKARVLWVDRVERGDEVPFDEDVTIGGDEHARRELFSEKLRATIARLAPAKVEAPVKVEAPPPPPPPPPPARPPSEVGAAIIVASLGVAVRGRWFSYSDDAGGSLVPYSTFGAPGPTLSVEVYPAAGARIPIISDLGVTLAYTRAFALKGSPAALAGTGTSWDSLRAGLRYRLRVDDLPFQERPEKIADSTIFGLAGGVGFERFAFDAADSISKEAPDASYLYLHVGLDGRFPISRAAVMVHASWLGVLSSGAVYGRFRDPSLGGFEAGGGLAVKLASGFEIRLTADYTRWFATFAPKFADPYIAGGAVDEMLALQLGLAYAY